MVSTSSRQKTQDSAGTGKFDQKKKKKSHGKLGAVVYAYNPSTQEVESGEQSPRPDWVKVMW